MVAYLKKPTGSEGFQESPVRRAFNQKSAAKTNNFNEKVNIARVNNVTTAGLKAVVSAAEGNRENVVKFSACWIWRQGRLKIKGFLTVDALDGISDEFGIKTGSCKVNDAKKDVVMMGEMDFLNASTIRYSLTISPTIYASYTEQFWATAKSKIVNNETQIHAKVDGKTIVISESSVRNNLHFNDEDGRDTEIPQSSGPPEKVGDKAVHKELGDRVERVATTATSFDAEQDSGNILKTQSTAVPNVPLSQEIGTGGGNTPGSDEERLEQHKLTDDVPLTPHDSPLLGGHTPGSDEGRLKQDKLTDIVTALSQKVERLEYDLKKTKKLYATAFKKLINRGTSLIEEMDLDAGISLVPPHVEVQGRYGQNLKTQEGFGDGQEVSTAAQVSTASTFVSITSPQRNTDTTGDDLTLAKIIMEIRKSATKDKGG
ncbi:hypothetical protein Tco_0442220 [Tanacetum coccineum]